MKKKTQSLKSVFDTENLIINVKFKNQLKMQLFAEKRNEMATKQQLNIRQLIKQKSFMYSSGFAVLLLIVTATYALQNRNDSLARQSIIEDTIELPQLEGVLGIDEIRTLAQNDAPTGATIVGIELENEDGTVLYKVAFSDGSFRLYDAKTGLAFVDSVNGLEIDESVPIGFVAGITLQRAREIASAQRPGEIITKIELETENGVVVYSVRFADEGRVDVNATSGAVLRVRGAGGENISYSSDDDSDDDSSNDSEDDSNDDDGDDDEDSSDSSGSDSGTGSDDDGDDD